MDEMRFQNIRFLIRKPKDFSPDKKYPILLFLHGAGTRGNDISLLHTNPFMQITALYDHFPFVTIAPLCEENTWFDVFESLKLFVKNILELPFADDNRVYLMGASMGGYATWQLAMSMPECFAAVVPICGGGMYWNAGRLADVSVWAFHGGKDPVVFVEESVKMVDAVNRGNGNAQLTVYPENGHDAWSDTYRNPEVFSWMLKHKKRNNSQCHDQYINPEKYG